jgi:hypothetical protein
LVSAPALADEVKVSLKEWQEVNERLAELYPEDTATGYAVGDLRGAFVVTRDLSRD